VFKQKQKGILSETGRSKYSERFEGFIHGGSHILLELMQDKNAEKARGVTEAML
jgi:hypothetical protein